MSAVNTENIHLGLGNLEIGEYVNGVFSAYRDAGAIKAEGNIQFTRTVLDFMTGRPNRTVKREATVEDVTVTFTLAELTVANLKSMLGAGVTSSNVVASFLDGAVPVPKGDGLSDSVVAVSAINERFTMGGQCDVFNVALRFTHLKSCSTGKRQIWEFYIASPTGDLAVPYSETDWQQTAATWKLLSDLTKAPGQEYFQLFDEK